MQMRLPPSIPPQSPIATPDEEMGDDETRVHDMPLIMYEEQEDARIEQGKLTDHEPVDEEPGQASDLDPAWDKGRRNRCWQDTDTLSSSSPLSTPPASDNEHDRTSDGLGDEPTSLAASIGSDNYLATFIGCQ